MYFIRPRAISVLSVLFVSMTAFAATPVVTVTSPANHSQTTSPVNFVASATSPGCAQGISTMRIYSAPHVSAYTGSTSKMNTYINLPQGTYNAVVQAWDNCGNVGKAYVTVTTTGEATPAGFVYAVNTDLSGNTPNNIQGFTIVGSNGALAPTGQAPVSANVYPASIASDKGGYRLYVGDFISGDVFAYFIDRRNGYLNPVPGSPFPVHRSVTAVAVHPSGQLVFAARSEYAQGDGVSVFQVQNDGSLKEAAGSPYPTQVGPFSLRVDPSGQYLYVADQVGYVDAFQIDSSSAALTPISGSPYQIPGNPVCGSSYPISVYDPFGKYLYVGDGVGSLIDGYNIASSTGTLTPITSSPWKLSAPCEGGGGVNEPATLYSPKSLAVDGSGKFMYALDLQHGNIVSYSIASNGALHPLKTTAVNTACSGAVRTDSTGNYLYVGGVGYCNNGIPPNFGALLGFSIDHTTGDLTPLPTSPYTYPFVGRGFVVDMVVTP